MTKQLEGSLFVLGGTALLLRLFADGRAFPLLVHLELGVGFLLVPLETSEVGLFKLVIRLELEVG